MTVYLEWEVENPFSFDVQKTAEALLTETMGELRCPYQVQVNVVLTGLDEIQEVNAETRRIDAATDVLSFPGVEFAEPGDFSALPDLTFCIDPESRELMLGDVMICVPKVLSQAEEYGHSPYREFSFLLTHSLLHLCGFDHMEETDRIQMEARQREILDTLGIGR